LAQIYPNSADKEYEDIKGQIGSNINPNSADKDIKGQIGSNLNPISAKNED
jgi:hypothetical protein